MMIPVKAKREHGHLVIRDSSGNEFTIVEDEKTKLLRISSFDSLWIKPVASNVIEIGVTDWQGIQHELHMTGIRK